MNFNMDIKTELNDIEIEPMDFSDIDIPNSCDYDESITQNMNNEYSMVDTIMNQVYPIQNHQSVNETEEIYIECYPCPMCDLSYNTHFDLVAHFQTHINDDTFHHSYINSISEPLPQSSIKPSKYIKCNECQKMCKSQEFYNEHMLSHTGEKPHHIQMENKIIDKIYPIQNHQSESETEEIYIECYPCSMCDLSYNTHFDLVAHFQTHINDDTFHHSYTNSISEPLPQSSIKPSKYIKCNKCQKICKSQQSYNEHMLSHIGEKLHHFRAEGVKSKRDAIKEAIGSSRQDIQNMLRKIKEKQRDYNTEEYQTFLETLILEKKSTGQFNEAKFIGPLFWKNALVKAGLIEKNIFPMQFQGQLRLIECMSCRKYFTRVPKSNEGNILPTKPPCFSCFMIKTESTLSKHKAENHSESPPYICKECLLELDTWYKFVQHMKMHLRCAEKCSECVYDMMNKPDTVMFLCHICEMSFDSDGELKEHVQTHIEN